MVSVQKINENLDKIATVGLLEYLIDRPKYYLEMKVSNLKRENLLVIGKLNTEMTIVMPLPTQMVDSSQVLFSETELGAAIGNLNNSNMMKTVRSAGDSIKERGNLSGVDVRGALPTAEGVAGAVTGIIAGATGAAGASIAGLAGYTPNQFLTILLKGPAYKHFSLNWKVSPRNERESESIRKIIQYINNSKAPGITGGGAFFTFPKIFELGFRPNADKLYKFKPAVIDAFTVNYSGSGTPAFYRKTGSPDVIDITINFLELEFWLTGQYNDDPDPYNRSSLSPTTVEPKVQEPNAPDPTKPDDRSIPR